MSIPNFFDLTDGADAIDKVLHNFIEVLADAASEDKAIFIEDVDGELKYIARLIDRTDLSNGTIDGEDNQILLSDGSGWAKNSGLLYQESSVDFFEDTRFSPTLVTPTYFSVKGRGWFDITILQFIVTEIGEDSETVLYDMSTDDNLDGILTGTNEFLTGVPDGERTLADSFVIDTTNHTILLDSLSGSIGQIGIKNSIFDSSKRYRIEISTSRNSCDFYCGNTIIDSGGVFLFDTAVSASKIRTLYSPNNSIDKQFIIKNGDSLDNSYYFTMSGTSRFTLHDNSKADITKGATLFMHGAATLEIDDGENRYTGPAAGSSSSSIAALRLHDKAVFDMSQGAWLKMAGTSSFIVEGTSFFKLGPDNNYSPYFGLGGGAVFLINADYGSANKASAMVLNPDGLIYISDGGSGADSSNRPDVDYSALGRNPSTMAPANHHSTSIKISGETYLNIDTESGASTYIKISGDNNPTSQVSNSQVCLILTGNVFNQMSGNAHSEMHDSSKFIMRGVKTEPYWYGAPAWVAEPVEQGTGLTPLSNGPILGMYGKSVVTIGSFKDGEKSLTKNIRSIIVDPDATEAPTSYETLSETGKQAVFNLVSSPENTITGATITSTTVNPDGGFNVRIGRVSYTQHPVLETEDFSGTRTSLTYTDQYTTETPATVADLTEQSKQQVISALGFSRFVTNVVFTGGAITRNGNSFTISNLTYTCTAIPATYHLPKQEDYPYVEILDNAQLKLFNNANLTLEDDFTIQAGSNGIVFSDGANSESFTIEELTALKALLI